MYREPSEPTRIRFLLNFDDTSLIFTNKEIMFDEGLLMILCDICDYETIRDFFKELNISTEDLGCVYEDTIYNITGYSIDEWDMHSYMIFFTVEEMDLYIDDYTENPVTVHVFSEDASKELVATVYPSSSDWAVGYYILKEFKDYDDWWFFDGYNHNSKGSYRDPDDIDRIMFSSIYRWKHDGYCSYFINNGGEDENYDTYPYEVKTI